MSTERIDAMIARREAHIAKVGRTCEQRDGHGEMCGAVATVYYAIVTPTAPIHSGHGYSGPLPVGTRKYLCLACCDILASDSSVDPGSVRHV